ncbi:NACHT domain-containing protein [Streptomyces amakusaensis]|uniref:NACHT domain-containing protein n=1 Tax=Streptomyces amakusaensis TaxID=67271 RepID=A0ABW0AUW4_9ACTN
MKASDTAGLAAVGLAVVAGLVAVVALRKQSQANTAAFADVALARGWAGTLAKQVETGEGAVRRQLLGDDTRRINLVYRLHPAGARPAVAPGAGRLFVDGPGGPALPEIAAYYRQTRPDRLVITGAGGAGKTVLALELLLALVEGRGEADPVPVRVPLSRWDTERHALPELLVERLVEAYDWPRGMAEGLVRHGLVLPVLDGLDEMDAPGPGGIPDPAAPRATAVVEALNAYHRGREAGPLILTCRTAHYDVLHPQAAVVDAARIEVAPVGVTDAGEYLAGRALDELRWQPLTDHLAAEPTGVLAGVLSTPWRLGLTATVYHREGDPGDLLALPDTRAVDEHLLARYIPAAVRTAPNPNRYTAEQIHRWLHRLAVHLDPVGTAGGPPGAVPGGHGPEGTDLLLHELWLLAGRVRVKATDALLTGFAVLSGLLSLAPPPQEATAPIVGMAVAAGAFVLREPGAPKHWTNPFRQAGAKRRIVSGLAAGTIIGTTTGTPAGIMAGIVAGLTIGISSVTVGEPGANRGARAAMRSDALLGITTGIVAGLIIGLIIGILAGSAAGLTFGLTAGLIIGLTVVITASTASRRYLLFLVCSLGRLPFRLARFLDWAVGAGLLRYSGAGYQYRHRELQHWLRRNPVPPPRLP